MKKFSLIAIMLLLFVYLGCDNEDNDDNRTNNMPENMIFVAGGSFLMGDYFNDLELFPVHEVIVSDFYISKFEVTQSEWAEYMDEDPYNYGLGDDYPAYYTSWYEVLVFCNLKSLSENLTPCYEINGSTDTDSWGDIPSITDSTWDNVICNWDANGYRLPTEAEWEYAAKGGFNWSDSLIYSGSNNIEDVAWYRSNTNGISSYPVGMREPNQINTYDMSGNISEWCWDWYSNDYYQYCDSIGIINDPKGPNQAPFPARVSRGGYWFSSPDKCTVALRDYAGPGNSGDNGFRIVRAK